MDQFNELEVARFFYNIGFDHYMIVSALKEIEDGAKLYEAMETAINLRKAQTQNQLNSFKEEYKEKVNVA